MSLFYTHICTWNKYYEYKNDRNVVGKFEYESEKGLKMVKKDTYLFNQLTVQTFRQSLWALSVHEI